MEATPIVAAFADSPRLRETLCVLLEHDCDLRALDLHALARSDALLADVAVIAMQTPGPILQMLADHWPTLPIIAVDVAAAQRGQASPPHPSPQVHSVPLEPHAIRSAVQQELARLPNGVLRATVRRIAEALRQEISYACAALRAFSALHATGADADTHVILGTVMAEQCQVLMKNVDHLHRFRERPRSVSLSSEFGAMLCRHLERPDSLTAARGFLCECEIDSSAPHRPGPVGLIPLLIGFLRAHLRRRADSPLIRVHATPSGVVLNYARRPGLSPSGGSFESCESWPLLLAALALQPWSWRIAGTTNGADELIRLCATA